MKPGLVYIEEELYRKQVKPSFTIKVMDFRMKFELLTVVYFIAELWYTYTLEFFEAKYHIIAW